MRQKQHKNKNEKTRSYRKWKNWSIVKTRQIAMQSLLIVWHIIASQDKYLLNFVHETWQRCFNSRICWSKGQRRNPYMFRVCTCIWYPLFKAILHCFPQYMSKGVMRNVNPISYTCAAYVLLPYILIKIVTCKANKTYTKKISKRKLTTVSQIWSLYGRPMVWQAIRSTN